MTDRLQKTKAYIDGLLATRPQVIVAIDGNCTAGKSTLAGLLAEHYNCNVIHMDDFFLRPEQRTPERYAQPGGNVDYERFQDEVLIPLKKNCDFSYRPLDCKTFTLKESVAVKPKKLTVIEGTYSQHPYFGDPYDLKITLTIDPETQRQRIGNRPAHLQERFLTLWIPMERTYLETFDIPGKSDLVF